MTPQYLIMTPQWDSVFQNPANQQPLRYRFRLVTGYAGPSFDPYLPWLGPIVPFAYHDLLAVYNNTTQQPNFTQNPGFVLRDAKGNPLFLNWNCSAGTCPQYCGDPTNPGFRQFQISALQGLAKLGYNLYLDDVDPKVVTTDGTGNPVLPAGVTPQAFMRAVVELVEEIRKALPASQIIHNSSFDSSTPQELVDRMVKAADYQNIERGFADPNLNGDTTAAIFAFIDRVHALGRKVIIENYTSQLPGTGSILPYLLAAFRTVMQPGDLFCIEDMLTPDPSLDVDTGAPYARTQIAPYQYSRAFQNGWAWVDLNAKNGSWTPLS